MTECENIECKKARLIEASIEASLHVEVSLKAAQAELEELIYIDTTLVSLSSANNPAIETLNKFIAIFTDIRNMLKESNERLNKLGSET
jgi:hypothetical protein